MNQYDNLYFEVLNEPWAGGVSDEWLNHVADLIKETEDELEKVEAERLDLDTQIKEIRNREIEAGMESFQ